MDQSISNSRSILPSRKRPSNENDDDNTLQRVIDMDTQSSKVDAFSPLVIGNDQIEWLDVFFERVHPIMPIFSEQFIRKNHAQLPLFLLHGMYANTQTKSLSLAEIESGDEYHYMQCQKYYHVSHENPTFWTVNATVWMAMYAMTRAKYMAAGVTMLSTAIRYACQLGMFDSGPTALISSPSMDTPTAKRCMQMLALTLYEKDFSTSFSKSLPMLLTDNINIDLITYVDHDNVYSAFYEARIWIHASKLLLIARKVFSVVRLKEQKTDGQRRDLDNQLSSWYEDLPDWMKKNYRFTTDISSQNPPPTYAGFYIAFYHAMRILLYKRRVISQLNRSVPRDQSSLEIIRTAANEITKIYYGFGVKEVFVPSITIFASFPIYFAGIVHCFFDRHQTSSNLDSKIDFSLDLLDYYRSKVHQGVDVYYQKLIALKESDLDPASVLETV